MKSMSGLSCELVYSVNRLTDFGLKDSGSAQAGASILTFSAMSRPTQGPHSASYAVDTNDAFPVIKAAWARSWPLTYL
jgi:hypothetical protein